MDFHKFGLAVNNRLKMLSKDGAEFFVTAEPNTVWQAYLAAFPEGTNPIYRAKTEHDCSCCKAFIRGMGNVVTIYNGVLTSLWDIEGADVDPTYKVVAAALHKLVTTTPIQEVWRTSERSYGKEQTLMQSDSGVVRWNHFFGNTPQKQLSSRPDKARGDYRTSVQVFIRGLTELKPEAVNTVIELAEQNAIYRGAEHLPALKAFSRAQREFDGENYAWLNAASGVARFRNTVIGTLVQDLSEGVAVDRAVRSFEVKIAPTNYKRTTALITESMVKSAMKTISELGLESALQRRFAKISDVSVSNVLWVNREVAPQMRGGIEQLLLSATTAKVISDKAEDISIDEFFANVLPKATTLELVVRNTQVNNFVSLTAPATEGVNHIFKWDNDFAWSYSGEVTDSIKERVKAAGGNVNAKLRFSLAWSNFDDLDLHVTTPNGMTVYFGKRQGILDVDMNAFIGTSREPVENAAFQNPLNGRYRVRVHQFQKRETQDVGFTLELADETGAKQYHHPKGLPDRESVEIFVTYSDGIISGVELSDDISEAKAPKIVWGVSTEKFVPVDTVMLSPNYWDLNRSGNKHWFFLLKGCKNPDSVRGIYNEFLNSRLEEHRKVFEVLGSKTKCQPTDDQLSGVGFSSTRNDSVTVRVTGGIAKTFKLKF